MVGEFALLAGIRALLDGDGPRAPLGVDDDAAVLSLAGASVVAAVDTVVDGIHFDRGVSSWQDVGFKAVAVNVSDVAAVGGTPAAVLVSLQRPADFGLEEATALYEGIREAADRWGCLVVGGDTVSSPTLAVSVTVLGTLVDDRRLLRRDAAQPGDLVAVVGELGLAAGGLALVQAGGAPAQAVLDEWPVLLASHRRPHALPEAASALVAAGVRACIDVSDGLGRDLGHVADASGVQVRLESSRIPLHPGVAAAAVALGTDPLELTLAGGEDFALAVTLDPSDLARLDVALEAVGLQASVVGEVVAGRGVVLVGAGEDRDVATSGFEH